MTFQQGDAKQPPDRAPIPEKLYFKIGEVAELVGVQTHVLRYWEKEVPAIRPAKSASKQRRYRRRDVELFREIKSLLYKERYTLAGARKYLMSGSRTAEGASVAKSESGPQVACVELPKSLGEDGRLEKARQGLRDLIVFATES